MREKILLAFAILLFIACDKKGTSTEEQSIAGDKKSLVDPNNRQDTVYFGYVLNKPTKDITKKLIDENAFIGDIGYSYTFTVVQYGQSQKITIDGYAFDLYIAGKKYNALLTLFDTDEQQITLYGKDGNLMSLQIYIQGREKEPIIEALKKQYGEPCEMPGEGYDSTVPRDWIDAFWNVSNKAVYLATPGNFMILVYEDIIAIRNKENEKNALKQAEKEYYIERSKKTKL